MSLTVISRRFGLAAIASLQSLAWTALDDAERAYRKNR